MHDPFKPGPSGGFESFMFDAMPVLVMIVFAFVIVVFIFIIAGNIRNARAPRQTVFARVVAKRMEVGGDSYTHYYITLEFENGERREFLDVKKLYGLVVEGDIGYAAIQGNWIVAFERQPAQGPYRGSG